MKNQILAVVCSVSAGFGIFLGTVTFYTYQNIEQERKQARENTELMWLSCPNSHKNNLGKDYCIREMLLLNEADDLEAAPPELLQ